LIRLVVVTRTTSECHRKGHWGKNSVGGLSKKEKGLGEHKRKNETKELERIKSEEENEPDHASRKFYKRDHGKS